MKEKEIKIISDGYNIHFLEDLDRRIKLIRGELNSIDINDTFLENIEGLLVDVDKEKGRPSERPWQMCGSFACKLLILTPCSAHGSALALARYLDLVSEKLQLLGYVLCVLNAQVLADDGLHFFALLVLGVYLPCSVYIRAC